MKICFIGDSESIHTKRWYNYFEKEGYSIEIISWNSDSEIPQKKIHCISNKFILKIKYIRAIFILFWSWRKIRDIKPDLIHIHMISNYGWTCLFVKKIPVIISIGGHDILIRAKESKIHFYLSKFLFKRANGITTSSKFIKSELIKGFKIDEKKIKCFCWGIDFKLFSGFSDEDRKNNKRRYNIPENCVVLMHNRYFPAAKYKILFNSIKKLSDFFQEFLIIVIYGTLTDNYRSEIKIYAESLNLNNNIMFIEEFVSQEKMAEILSFSDIYINILTHDQRGLSILESMAAGCIPTVNNLPVYHEFIKDGINGFIFESEDEEHISKKLFRIIKNLQGLKPKISKYNYEYIKKNDDKDKNESIMKELYMEVLN